MRIRIFTFLMLFILLTSGVVAGDKKLRFAGTAGIVLRNDLLGQSSAAGTAGGGLTIAYPVGPIDHAMNVEIGIANWYNVYPYGDNFTHTLRFGFGIRVFLNVFSVIRPYFTHDICSYIVWVSDRPDHASTFGILLGLGVDIPIHRKEGDTRRESSSIFFDFSYNTFKLANFDPAHEAAKFISASLGYSWLIGGKTGGAAY